MSFRTRAIFPSVLTVPLASEMTSNRWLGVSRTDRYIWLPGPLFQPFKSPNQFSVPTRLDPEKPHILSYVVDSTPFDQFSLRSSEVKTIILVALFSHTKAEYCHLDYFGVCTTGDFML